MKSIKNKNLFVILFGMFMTQFANMVYPMLTLLLQDKCSMNATRISLVLVVNFIALALSAFIGGRLADRYNKKKVILFFDAVSVVLYLLGGVLPFSYITLAMIILAGTFQQLEIASYSMLVSELSAEDEKDKSFSLLYMSINVGMFFSSAISGFLILKHTSLVFFLNALGVFISAVVVAVFLKYIPTERKAAGPEEKEQKTTGPANLLSVFKLMPVMIVYLCMTAIADAVHNEYAYIIPLEITRVFKENNSGIYGTMISASCVIIILFTALTADLLHKFSHTVKMRLSNLFQGIGYFVIFLGFIKGWLILLYAGFLVYIMGEIVDSLFYEAYMVSKVPEEYSGRVYGLFSTVLKITVMIVDVLTGILYDRDPHYAWFLIFALILITLILTEIIHAMEGRKLYAENPKN